MSFRMRTMLLVIVIEVLLAGFYLYSMAAPGSPEQIVERGRLIGMVMGVILGVSPLLYLLARSNDRKKAEKNKGQ